MSPSIFFIASTIRKETDLGKSFEKLVKKNFEVKDGKLVKKDKPKSKTNEA